MDKENSPVNMAELLDIMGNDMELIKECFDDFLRDGPAILDHIRSAITSGNHEALEQSAHSIKGSLSYLAAADAAAMALEMENAGRSHVSFEIADEIFNRFERECKRVFHFIDNMPLEDN